MAINRQTFLSSGLAVATGLGLIDAFWIEKFFIETNEFYVGDANKSSPTIRLLQLSDLHLQTITYSLKNLAARINKLQPHLLLITGDAIDKRDQVSVLAEYLNRIDQSVKKVAILGNWEYWGNVDVEKLKAVYRAHNCTLLINETIRFQFDQTTVSITGVDDYVGGKANYTAAVQSYQPSNYHVVLTHCPEYRDTIAAMPKPAIPIDFILAGHTHGGQINLLGYTPFLPRGSGLYVKGWYPDPPKLYVSKGIGYSVIPARFGARAEIALFHLKANP